MLTRTSGDAVFHGHVAHAEIQMDDAVAMFQTLLRRSDDPMLRFRAAQAYNTAGNIQRLLGRYQQSRNTYQQAVDLLAGLADDLPDQPAYRAEMASSHGGLGMALYGLSRMKEAERAFTDALAIREQLAARSPEDPQLQMALADALGNLGQVYREMKHLDEAEQTCRRVLSILHRLPPECALGPEGFSRLGAAEGNLGLVLRDRGQLDEAKKCLEGAFWEHYLARSALPDNPTYCEGLYNACWNFADLVLRQGDHARAAAEVDEIIKFFPGWLRAYAEGVTLLGRCAELAAKDPAAAAQAEVYDRRAGKLLKQSAQSVDRPPYSANELAWHLATWPDEAFRDARRAVALAQSAARAMPENAAHWNTLGVARYRANNWQAAIEALDKSVALSSGGDPNDWLFLAMAHWRLGSPRTRGQGSGGRGQGPGGKGQQAAADGQAAKQSTAVAQQRAAHRAEARRWYDKAVQWMEKNKPEDKELGRFRTEAADMLGTGDQPAPREETHKPLGEEAKPEVSRQGAKAQETLEILCALAPLREFFPTSWLPVQRKPATVKEVTR